MAKFSQELPYELISELQKIEKNTNKIFGEMTQAGAKVVYNNILNNIGKSFKTYKNLLNGLRITKIYYTPSDDGVNTHIGFYGYDSTKINSKYPKGVPIPLIALAREYGTSSGEKKKPFFRKSFKKAQIENEMKKIEKKYFGD